MPEKLSNERIRYLLKTWPEFVFDYFYNYYKPKLIRHAEWRTHDADVAADIAHEAISFLWERRDWLLTQPQIDIEIFLITITRNKAINYFKREQIFDKTKKIDDDFLVTGYDPNNEQDTEERDRNIWNIIAKFPKRELSLIPHECVSPAVFASIAMNGNHHAMLFD